MHVVAVTPLYPPQSRVGSWLATHEYLAELVRRGHKVDVYRRMSGASQRYVHEGVTVHPGRKEETLDTAIAGADVVISHCGDDGMAAFLATRHRRPSVRMVHGSQPDIVDRLTGTTLAVFNSQSLADAAGWNGPQIVVHPVVRAGLAATPGSRVTLVNLSRDKGSELFWRLTKQTPDVRYLAVRGWGKQVVRRRANVRVLRSTPRMAQVYAQTRVLLMPSKRETFGLVGVEAMACGIPVIAHPTPGLRESLGDAGIFADRDHDSEWLDQIRRLEDPAEWEAASTAARARAVELSRENGRERFVMAVEPLALSQGGLAA